MEPWLYKKVLQKLEISTVNLGDCGFLDSNIIEDLILQKHQESIGSQNIQKQVSITPRSRTPEV